MVGPQMCGKSVTKSESERGKCQKRILRKGRMHERRMMIYFYFFAHKKYRLKVPASHFQLCNFLDFMLTLFPLHARVIAPPI